MWRSRKAGTTEGRARLLASRARIAAPVATVLLAAFLVGATWVGTWGSGGHWTNPPLRWCFVDPGAGTPHPAATWSPSQKNVARAAIAEWYTPAAQRGFQILETTPQTTPPCDITIRWEGAAFFKDWNPTPPPTYTITPTPNPDADLRYAIGYWHGPHGQTDPIPVSPDFPDNEVYLNLTPRAGPGCGAIALTPFPWYVDPAPADDIEFGTPVANGTCTYYFAGSGTPAAGEIDLYTVIKHEFGHALGLTHATPPTPGLMARGKCPGERRHLCPDDTNRFLELYPTLTPTPTATAVPPATATPTPTATHTSGGVGGIAEVPPLEGVSAEEAPAPAQGSGRSFETYAALAGGLAAAGVALGAGGLYIRRRWLR